jgi:Cdc6-like AAA superfamily ATPase
MAVGSTGFSSDKFDRDEYRVALNRIIELNGNDAANGIHVLSLRTAARAVPIIASRGDLDFWLNVHDKDMRVEYLAMTMSVVGALIDEYVPDPSIPGYVGGAMEYTTGPHTEASNVRALNTVASVLCAYHALFNTDLDASADSAAWGATELIRAGYGFEKELLFELEEDINQAVRFSQMTTLEFNFLPLWRGGVPDLYLDFVHKLAHIVETLPWGEEHSEQREIVDIGLNYLKLQVGIVDSAAEDFVADSKAKSRSQIDGSGSRRQLPEATSPHDHLNRGPLIKALASVLAHKANSEHQTIGLLGDWGIGKSTWVRHLKKELLTEHEEQPYLFGEFNAWAYEHTDNLQAGIAQEVIKALSSPAPRLEDFDPDLEHQRKKSVYSVCCRWLSWKWDRAMLTYRFASGGEFFKLLLLLFLAVCPITFGIPEALSDYLASKAAEEDKDLYRGAAFVGNSLWFLGFGVYFIKELPKLFANPLAKELLTYLRLPDYAQHLGTIPVMRKNIESLCKIRLKSDSEKSARLLFVVDDLDRCGHKGIVKVFEAVRLVLEIKNVTVIIAVDQHIALAALALHYQELAVHHKLGNPRAIARDYLAKVVHLPIILSNPIKADIENYLQRLWMISANEVDHKVIEQEQSLYDEQENADVGEKESDESTTEPQTSSQEDKGVEGSGSRRGTIKTRPSPVKNLRVVTEVASLSWYQRRAFIYWLDYFGLTNPRQVKRLNNTYNLLLNCYRGVDNQPVEADFPTSMPKSLFPMMIALITMEYLNSIDDQVLRNELRSQLFVHSIDRADRVPNTAPLTNEFIYAFHLLLSKHIGLVEKVRPFVLPAIEKC